MRICSVTLIIPFHFVVQAQAKFLAKEPATNDTDDVQESLDKLADRVQKSRVKFVDELISSLFDRAFKMSPLHLGIRHRISLRPFFLVGTLGAPALTRSHSRLQLKREAALGRHISTRTEGRVYAQGRVLNFDFVPRLGWKNTVFPAVISPWIGSVVTCCVAFWLSHTFGFQGLDATAHQALAVLCSFLAVFRTQQAYQRYWEGRGVLGNLMAGIIDLAAMASVLLRGQGDEESKKMESKREELKESRAELARLLRVYMRETTKYLRINSVQTKQMSNYWLEEDALRDKPFLKKEECDLEVTEEECELLATSVRPPILVLQWVRAHIFSSIIDKGLGHPSLTAGADRVLSTLQASWNGCQKIATMPLPQPYTQMSRWLIFFFVFSVPLPFLKIFHHDILPLIAATMLVTFGYYGLDYCANELQNPFIASFGGLQLDGRYMKQVAEDVDILLLGPMRKSDNPGLGG